MSTLSDALGAASGAASSALEQCVVFVENVTGTHYDVGTASQMLNLPGAQSVASGATPNVGDLAIWGANQGGASGAGHVGIVSSISPSGTAYVTSTNWPEGQLGEHTMALTSSNYPTAFLPSSLSGGGDATLTTANITAGGVTANAPAGPAKVKSLGDILSDVPGSGLPVVGTVIKGLTAPVAIVEWVAQGGVWKRGVLLAAALFAFGLGLFLLLRRDLPSGAAMGALAA